MEKRRIRLEINGVVCGLITQESEEYMESLANEVGDLMKEILDASPFITREAAALTAALSYCDDAKKNGQKAFELQERVDELEVEAELWQEEKAAQQRESAQAHADDSALLEKVRQLEKENTALTEAAGQLEAFRRLSARLEDENTSLQKAISAASHQETEELQALRKEAAALKAENEALKAAPASEKPAAPARPASGGAKRRKNPLRYEEDMEQKGFVSFFEKEKQK